MNSFRQHIPNFVDVDRPVPIQFADTKELLELEIVRRYKNESFSHFAMSDECLMVIRDGGKNWWVVGYIEKPDEIDLPQWEAPVA